MKTICVAGATSKTGKTSLIKALIPHLPGWGVCKVTTCHYHPDALCPREDGTSCGICMTLDRPYYIIEEAAITAKPGTDTGIYYHAGAVLVLWVQSRPENLAESLGLVLDRAGSFPGLKGMLFEGNHTVSVVQPDYSIMMAGSGDKFKESAEAVKDLVDDIVYHWDYKKGVELVLQALGDSHDR